MLQTMNVSPVMNRRHSAHDTTTRNEQTPRVAPDPSAFRQTSFSEKKRPSSENKICPVAPTKSPSSGTQGRLLASLQARFTFIKEIGEGDFSKVYYVLDKQNGKEFALKGLKGLRRRDLKQAQRECEHGKLFSPHPNCVQYFEYFASQLENVWILMELCETSLEKHMLAYKLPEEKIWRLLADLLCGIRHIHSKGFIHCDIKPANVLLIRDQNALGQLDFIAKIGDFGLTTRKEEWQPFESEGDKYYMAPELLDDGGLIRETVDIFSLGVMLLEMAYDLDLRECDWKLLREVNFIEQLPNKFKTRVSLELAKLISAMMDPIPTNRPTAEKLLQLPSVKRFIRHSHKRDYSSTSNTPKSFRNPEPTSGPVFPSHPPHNDTLPILDMFELDMDPKKSLLDVFNKSA